MTKLDLFPFVGTNAPDPLRRRLIAAAAGAGLFAALPAAAQTALKGASQFRVLIVGAGVGGATAAINL